MKFVQSTLCLISLCALLSCAKEESISLRMMTFNIRYGTANDGDNAWELRKEILIECLNTYTPDILGTQEGLPFQLEYIKANFPNWGSFGVGRYHGVETERSHECGEGEGCIIFYDTTKIKLIKHGTYWHSETPKVAASISWGNSLPRVSTWSIFTLKGDGKRFAVFNTHFHWDEPYVSNTSKLIMEKWQEVAGDLPTILMGDFNLRPDSPSHEMFCGKSGPTDLRGRFVDGWQVLNKPEEGGGTSHSFTGEPQNRIDWILATPEFQFMSVGRIDFNKEGRYPSDHFPVWAEVNLVL